MGDEGFEPPDVLRVEAAVFNEFIRRIQTRNESPAPRMSRRFLLRFGSSPSPTGVIYRSAKAESGFDRSFLTYVQTR